MDAFITIPDIEPVACCTGGKIESGRTLAVFALRRIARIDEAVELCKTFKCIQLGEADDVEQRYGSGLKVADTVTLNGGFDGAQMLSPCLLYTSPSPRDVEESRMPSSA